MSTDKTELAKVRGLKKLSWMLLTAIQLIAGGLGIYYAFLTLLDAPFDRMAKVFDASSLIRFGLFLFFFGWLWGATDDTKIMRSVFERDPQNGNIGPAEIGGFAAFVIMFVALFQLNDRLVLFQGLLLGFICVNVVTCAVIARRTRAIYNENAALYLDRGDHSSMLKLAIVSEYMNGNWQRRRFAVLVGLAAFQLLVAVMVKNGQVGAAMHGMVIKGIPGDVVATFIPGILFIIYVLVSELWMKIYRIKVKSDMVTIDYVESSYSIAKRRGSTPPELNLRDMWDRTEATNDNYI
jgi:hypothetical protein